MPHYDDLWIGHSMVAVRNYQIMDYYYTTGNPGGAC